MDIDLVSNLTIIPRIKLKTFSSHQIIRSIILSHLGENFQSTLPSQLLQSSCMGLLSNQDVTFKIFSHESKHCLVIGENVFFQSAWMNNIFWFTNLSYRWLEKVYKDQIHLFSIF